MFGDIRLRFGPRIEHLLSSLDLTRAYHRKSGASARPDGGDRAGPGLLALGLPPPLQPGLLLSSLLLSSLELSETQVYDP